MLKTSKLLRIYIFWISFFYTYYLKLRILKPGDAWGYVSCCPGWRLRQRILMSGATPEATYLVARGYLAATWLNARGYPWGYVSYCPGLRILMPQAKLLWHYVTTLISRRYGVLGVNSWGTSSLNSKLPTHIHIL